PVFTLTAALSVAIGIGANTAIFTVANALLLRAPAGVAHPGRIVDIGVGRKGQGFNPRSYPDYLDLRQRATTFEGLYASELFGEPLGLREIGTGDAVDRVFGQFVTTNFFTVLGARPAIGRLFADADGAAPGQDGVVVLSHRFWTRRFKEDRSIVGRTLELNGHPFTVVGVAADGFQGTRVIANDLWLPMSMITAWREPSILTARGNGWLMIGGRLKADVPFSRAAAEVEAIAHALERDHPDSNRGKELRVRLSSAIPGADLPVAIFLAFLLGVVALVLLIACANLAGV